MALLAITDFLTIAKVHKEDQVISMDVSTAKWLSEMGMEDPSFLYQYQMDFLQDSVPNFIPNFTPQTPSPDFPSFNLRQSLSDSADFEPFALKTAILKPEKRQKINQRSLNTISQRLAPSSSSSPFPNVISFGNHSSTEQDISEKLIGNIINIAINNKEEPCSPVEMNFPYDYGTVKFGEENRRNIVARSPIKAKYHVIAERKRREKLNQGFIALSALLPGLTKLDKASILGVAIQHIQELQGNARILEDKAIKRKRVDYSTIVSAEKNCMSNEDDNSLSVYNFNDNIFAEGEIEVEIRVNDNDLLIRVHCEKQNGLMGKIYSELEKFNLMVINSNTMPFGHISLAVSIVAQMDGQSSISTKDLENNLRSALCI